MSSICSAAKRHWSSGSSANCSAHGWQLRAAVADTPGAAWALAWYGGKGEEEGEGGKGKGRVDVPSMCFLLPSLPSASLPPSAFSPLPLEALRLPEPIVALLHSLGVWQIAQLDALPRHELSSRFGPELLDCLDRVTGRLSEPLPAWEPPPQFEVCWSAEFPTARRETIEAALEHLVRRLAAMLTQAGRGAMRLECLLKCTAGEPLQVAVGLFRPSAWAKHLARIAAGAAQVVAIARPGRFDPPGRHRHRAVGTAAAGRASQEGKPGLDHSTSRA